MKRRGKQFKDTPGEFQWLGGSKMKYWKMELPVPIMPVPKASRRGVHNTTAETPEEIAERWADWSGGPNSPFDKFWSSIEVIHAALTATPDHVAGLGPLDPRVNYGATGAGERILFYREQMYKKNG